MIASATVRYVRISSRKVRLVIDVVRGKTTRQAMVILANTPKRASLVVQKLLRSAVANAKQKGFDDENLVVTRIFADEGPTWKRMRPMSFGRGGRIRKRTCHITVELDQKMVQSRVKAVAKAAVPAKKPARRSPAAAVKAAKATPKKAGKQK